MLKEFLWKRKGNMFRVNNRIRISKGWEDEGRCGRCLGRSVEDRYGMKWVPVEWDDEDDPTFQKESSLEIL